MKYFSFGDYRLDTLKNEIRFRDKALELEPQVYGLLELFITRHGDIVSRDDIIAEVWNGRIVENSTIDNRIRAARSAIGDTGKAQKYIKTYPNRGYKFIGEVISSDEASPMLKPKSLDAKGSPNNITPQEILVKRKFLAPLAGALLVGLFGVYMFSQSTKFGNKEDSASAVVVDNADIYRLAISDETNALPRVAILPFETIGNSSAYGLMPDLFEGQFNSSITAIKGITVVSLSMGLNSNRDFTDYDALKKEFNLDYVIASKLFPYGEDFKLNISLIRVDDRSALFTEVYDLKPSGDGGLMDLPADIASKAILMTANALGLSMDDLPTSWKNYAFNLKIEEARALAERGDYKSLVKGAQIFREAIREEPNYLPAYSGLHTALSYLAIYDMGDAAALYKEMSELIPKMKEISPHAPETLLLNAFEENFSDGVAKDMLADFDPRDPISVVNYVLKKNPDHLMSVQVLASMSRFRKDQSETVAAFEKALYLAPTSAWTLTEYSNALFCNGEIDRAQDVVRRLKEWHPNHRMTLLAELEVSQRLGDHERTITAFKSLLEQGVISGNEALPFIKLSIDLGHPELALPHVRFSPSRALIYAMMSDRENALAEAAKIGSFTRSIRARMIVEDDYFPENYFVNPPHSSFGQPNGVTKANSCRLDVLARDIYVLKKIGSDKPDLLLPLLNAYYQDRNPQDLKTLEEFLGLMGLHALQGNPDKAVEVMDIAMDRGFLFIGSFKEPHLRELTAYPGVSERINKMQASADRLIEEHYYE